ncbi:MAG: hypothetical protein E7054_07090 [Lentisphaerae bacterium]|nr:hypothetical protein [Lentisphaerota bacterium]
MSETGIEEKIAELALQPAEYETDGERIKNRSADDTIKLLNFSKKRKITMKNAFSQIGVAQITTPGDFE